MVSPNSFFLQVTLIDIISTVTGLIGLVFMKNAGFFAMLKIASIVFCALLSMPILKQKLKWFHWTGILIMCAGIIIKSIPAILNTFDTKVCICIIPKKDNYDIMLEEP